MLATTKANMIEATRLTREGRLQEAMDLLRGSPAPQGAAPAFKMIDAAPAGLQGFSMKSLAGATALKGKGAARPAPPIQDGALYEQHAFSNGAGTMSYKLYLPTTHRGRALPLVVMLHGCTQDPNDFALGTRMNDLAEEYGFIVAYPEQTQAANMSKCWNWFNANEQSRDAREPSLIAGLTREIMQQHGVEADRVYIAGLSAGGAAASIMGATHPDLYAAIGVHSGLPCGAARDMPSAFAAMKQGSPGRAATTPVPTIVFHGDRDATVNPVNADHVIAQSGVGARYAVTTIHGEAGGASYTRDLHAGADGRVMLEQWTVHGAGHAWSGGSDKGSYAAPSGPDASREMVRFFLTHRLGGVRA